MNVVSIILIIVAAGVVWKDRDDLWRYLLVAVAAGFFVRTPGGGRTLDGIGSALNWVITTVQGWLA